MSVAANHRETNAWANGLAASRGRPVPGPRSAGDRDAAQKSVLFVAPTQAVTPLFPLIREAGYEVGMAETLSGALSYVKKNAPAIIFTKSRLPGYRAENILAASSEAMGDFPQVVVFTDSGNPDEASRYMELGARDYWLEPLVWDKIRALLPGESEEEPLPDESEAPVREPAPRTAIIGEHPVVRRVLALARQVARSKATVLISGESGTGKEKFARFLHDSSDRAGRAFVAINCAALPEHLLESELFGHEKGAFTGAITRKLGKFELASGGTILLDEISEMDLGLQAKLLRVLQEQEIDRVGGAESVRVDVRVLATTNRNIEAHVAEGKFRQDLFYRLNVIPLRLPPLRERGGDVLLLARYFMENFRSQYGLPRLSFSADAEDWLAEYDWPGNVRELQNLMERAVLLAGSGPVEKRHFLLDGEEWPLLEELESEEEDESVEAVAETAADLAFEGEVMPIAEMEKRMILRSLEETRGNRTQAANLLGISVRTLRNKLNDYRSQGLDI